ncbi:MAG: hypothetical protein NVS9B12_10640 [Vulcanimicrobiaceae bacterium]
MNSKYIISAAALALVLAGCNGSSGGRVLNPGGGGSVSFSQLDRLNRPAVNEVFATYARHDTNNRDNPADDASQLKNDIGSFMTGTAGRSAAITGVVQAVLVPDVQIADLSGTSSDCIGQAPGTCNNYLGVETAGLAGGGTQAPAGLKPFGGRALTDDVVDVSLAVIFGSAIPALTAGTPLATGDDGAEQDGRADASGKYPGGPCTTGNCTGGNYGPNKRPNLTTDNVSWQTAPKHFTAVFPYLGVPQ